MHNPLLDTYAIRILGKLQKPSFLKNSPEYKQVREYTFDDINADTYATSAFTPEIASQILKDFEEHRGPEHSSLLVHCLLGQSRSPAIAIALNELFELGNDTEELKRKYPLFNYKVYKTMIQESERKLIRA